MKIMKRYQVMLVIIGCVAAALIGRNIAGRMESYLNQLDKDIVDAQNTLQKIADEIEQDKGYLTKWEEIQGFQDKAVEVEQTDFTSYLQRLETERDFVFNILGSPVGRPMEEKPNVQILRYELTFFAELPDLVEFLAQLGSSQRLLRVERLIITRREIVRPDYLFPARRHENDAAARRSEILSVTMTVAIPAALPESETKQQEEPLS